MRFIFVLLFFIAVSFSCECNDNDDPVATKTGLSIRTPRSTNETEAQMIKRILNGASKTMTLLAETTDHFSDVYFQLKPEKLLQLFKGFSIIASIAGSFLPDPVEASTKQLLTAMNQGFKKIEDKIDKQTVELKTYLDSLTYSVNVRTPLATVSRPMNIYKAKKGEANRKLFLEEFCSKKLSSVPEYIIRHYEDIMVNAMTKHKYNKTLFDNMRLSLAKDFFDYHQMVYYYLGLKYTKATLQEKENGRNDVAESQQKDLSAIITKVYAYYNTSIFPGVIEDDIIRPVIDEGGDFCTTAQRISNELSNRYGWRSFYVIVSHPTTEPSNFAKAGYTSRIMSVTHKDKMALIMMASGGFLKNRQKFLNEGRGEVIQNEIWRNHRIDTPDLGQHLGYAKTDYAQMTAYHSNLYPCGRGDNSSVYTWTQIKHFTVPGMMYPMEDKVMFFIGF